MKISSEKMAAILALPAPKRYSHFVKVAADQDSVWGLYADGWALMETDDGQRVLPVWPAEVYAARFVSGEWANYHPRSIDLREFLEKTLPLLGESKIKLGVFPALDDKGVVSDIKTVAADLEQESSRFE